MNYSEGSNTCNIKSMKCNILRKNIEGNFDLISSLTFNAIKKTELIMHAVHSSRYLLSKLIFNLSHASMVRLQYISKWTEKSQTFKTYLNPFLSFVFHND